MTTWSHLPAAWRFVGGRRRYNRQRREAADKRRCQVFVMLRQGLAQCEIAKRLGCHESTVSRDVKRWALRSLVSELRHMRGLPVKLTIKALRRGVRWSLEMNR